jgi:3-oxoadipate enol-lactonase
MTDHSGRSLLYHQLDGAGEPVILLNGIMMTVVSWEGVRARLSPHLQVLCCDLRGQLMTREPPPPLVADHVPDLVALLDHLGIERVHVIGTSFGGLVGAYLAARHPRRVLSYTAIAAGDRFDDEMQAEVERWRRSCAAVLGGGPRTAVCEAIEPVVFSPAWRRANRRQQALRLKFFESLPDTWYQGLHGLLVSAPSVDLGPELSGITCPALVVAAGEDRFVPRERSRALADQIPGARFEVIEGAGHAVIAEQPQQVADLCLELVRNV